MAYAIFCLLLLSFHCRNKLGYKVSLQTGSAKRYAKPIQELLILFSLVGNTCIALWAAKAGLSYFLQFTCLPFIQLPCPYPSFIQSLLFTFHFTMFTAKSFIPGIGTINPFTQPSILCSIPSIKPWFTWFHFTHSSLLHFSRVKSTTLIQFGKPLLPPAALRCFIGTYLRLCKHATLHTFTVLISLPRSLYY